MNAVMSRAALAAGSLVAVAALLGACTGAEAEEPSPTPSTPTSPTETRFGFAPEEDRELLSLLQDFRPSEEFLEANGFLLEVDNSLDTAGGLAGYQWVVEPAACAPVLNALRNATPEDTTTRADDSVYMMFSLSTTGDPSGPGAHVRARIFDDTATTEAFVESARDADCTAFVEKDPSGGFPDVHAEPEIAPWQVPGVDAPTAILDVTIVEEYDPATDVTTELGFHDWNAFVALGRVMVQVKVADSDDPEAVAAALLSEIAAYLDAEMT